MNRIQMSSLAKTDVKKMEAVRRGFQDDCSEAVDSVVSLSEFEIDTRSAAGRSLPATEPAYSLFVPMHYESEHAYPLIVWLHSDGQSSRQVQSTMLDLSQRNYVAVAPQSCHGNGQGQYFWDQDLETIEFGHEAVVSALDQVQARFNINSGKIFLAGAGSGGTMAFRIAFQSPDLFAGVIALNGGLPDEMPFCNLEQSRQMPVFWAQGRNSAEFEESKLCHQLRLLHIAGFSVTLRQYPHAELLCSQPLSDINRWIMETISSAIL